MSQRPDEAWPLEIKLERNPSALSVRFEGGEEFVLPAEYLRVESPSAEVKGHGGGEMPPVAGKRDVEIVKIEPVGNYAIRLIFDDGHSTGLYSWPLLYGLGAERAQRWAAYLERLAAQGLSRS
jgi:DUF971 family protein